MTNRIQLKWTAYLDESIGRQGVTAKRRTGTFVVKPEGAANYQVVFGPKGQEYTGSRVLGTVKTLSDGIRLAEAFSP